MMNLGRAQRRVEWGFMAPLVVKPWPISGNAGVGLRTLDMRQERGRGRDGFADRVSARGYVRSTSLLVFAPVGDQRESSRLPRFNQGKTPLFVRFFGASLSDGQAVEAAGLMERGRKGKCLCQPISNAARAGYSKRSGSQRPVT